VVCPSIPNSAFVSRDGQSWNAIFEKVVCPLPVSGEFSNAYSQNKSAEMPLVQESSIPHVLLKHHWSRKEFTEGVLKCHLPQDTFQNYQIEIRTIQYISCLEQPSTPTARTTNFQQPTTRSSL
jgi:hypothetical protein